MLLANVDGVTGSLLLRFTLLIGLLFHSRIDVTFTYCHSLSCNQFVFESYVLPLKIDSVHTFACRLTSVVCNSMYVLIRFVLMAPQCIVKRRYLFSKYVFAVFLFISRALVFC